MYVPLPSLSLTIIKQQTTNLLVQSEVHVQHITITDNIPPNINIFRIENSFWPWCYCQENIRILAQNLSQDSLECTYMYLHR